MVDNNSITFKATANGLVLIMNQDDQFESILEQIEKKLEASGKFFKGASLAVKYRGKKLEKQQEEVIIKLMEDKSEAHIISFEEDLNVYVKEQEEAEYRKEKINIKDYFFKGIEEGKTKFYRGTVRSGQLVSYDGNLVIIGDVNPGGEVEATGNVIVTGTLRGIVHAGADGNKKAVVVAFSLQPMQLRIADIITRSPDEQGAKNSIIPELAYVKDNMVYIERLMPQYK